VTPGIGDDKAPLIGAMASNLGLRAQHHQAMQIVQIHFGERRSFMAQFAHLAQRIVVIDRYQMIAQRFAGYGDATLDRQHGFGGSPRVPLDCVRDVRELDVVRMLEVAGSGRRECTQPMQFGHPDSNGLGDVAREPDPTAIFTPPLTRATVPHMTTFLIARLDRAVETLPRSYPGPGGAVAALRNGEVLLRHAWGWANAERRIAFTPRTLFRMCSITKQFTCAVVLDAFPDPSVLDGDVRARLPLLEQPAPGALHLCHNQSGLRDYWAVAMLHGSPPEAPFGDTEAARVIAGTRTLQFAPGTRYSYVNQNFRLLSDIVQQRTGRSFAELLRTRVFDRAGMASALLAADTRALPDGTEGYEGTPTGGFRAAENRIVWTGDAGLGASLDDMIAWERHIDATRDDADALYSRLCAQAAFADGTSSAYGFGLSRRSELGRPITAHGGALRGWRSHRLYVPSERVSVVVMFNHLSDAHEAAVDVLAAVLGEDRPPRPAPGAMPEWLGAYTEPETGLSVRIEAAADGRVRLRFGHFPDLLDVQADGSASGDSVRLRMDDDGLWMERPLENHSTRLVPCTGTPAKNVGGRYRCAELDAELTVIDAGGVLYGGFSGFLGQGRMETFGAIGPDVWVLPCPRALDHTPPGDWTLAFRRDDAGKVVGVEVGCWLARRLHYMRVD
jgi:D-aminopeptidase